MKHRIFERGLLVAACSFAITAPALAQQAQEGGDAYINEIVVAAQNRKENIQDGPIAISVVPGVANIDNWRFTAPRTYGARLSANF